MKEAARLKEDRSANDDAHSEDTRNEDTCNEDTWVTGFVGRLAALIRNVGGSGK
jgi:hypothetical protein